MTFNRSIYDDCAYQQRLNENSSVLSYTLAKDKFYNKNQCRVAFGLVGGNEVSRIDSNLVDIESDLRNQTRQYSLCPNMKYKPNCRNVGRQTKSTGLPCGPLSGRKESMIHLPTCDFAKYHPRAKNIGYKVEH